MKENPEKYNSAENAERSYSRTRRYFENAQIKIQDDLRAMREGHKDPAWVHERQAEGQEVERILAALNKGDVAPAQESLLSMMEANIVAVRIEKDLQRHSVDIKKELLKRSIKYDELQNTEPFGQRLVELGNYFMELESPESSSSTESKTEASGREYQTTSPEEMDVAGLERTLADLKASETNIRQILSTVLAEENKFDALLRQSTLSRIRKSITEIPDRD